MKTIFKTVFGSQVYGTNSPDSDTDYKGIFIPDLKDVILGTYKESIVVSTNHTQSKNSSNDIDSEMKDLKRFVYDCMKGQTYALDMLFTPKKFWLEFSPVWEDLIKNRYKLLSKNVQPYIGYCRQQAGKYGLKGSRLGELIRVIEFLNQFSLTSQISELPKIETSEFVYYEEMAIKNSDKLESFITVLGKHFQQNKQVKEVLSSLNRMNEQYGHRAKLAQQNEGVDWKAISHAYRCCYQLIELAETQNVNFPLKEAQKLKDIKYGKYNYLDIQDEIAELMEQAIQAVENSSLPNEPDKQFWDKWIVDKYLN